MRPVHEKRSGGDRFQGTFDVGAPVRLRNGLDVRFCGEHNAFGQRREPAAIEGCLEHRLYLPAGPRKKPARRQRRV